MEKIAAILAFAILITGLNSIAAAQGDFEGQLQQAKPPSQLSGSPKANVPKVANAAKARINPPPAKQQAQQPMAELPPPAAANPQLLPQDEPAIINLADKAQLDLAAFVKWLATVRKMQIMDDKNQLSTNSNQVRFYGKTKVIPEEMFELVQAVLRSNNLALVKSDVKDWYRIVPLANVRPFAPNGDPKDFNNAEYVTAVFSLDFISPQEADTYLRQLIYVGQGQNAQSGSITTLPSRNRIIVTETAKKLQAIAKLIEEVDVPKEKTKTEFYKVKHLEATELEQQLKSLSDQTNSGPPQASGNNTRAGGASTKQLRIASDIRTNRLILIGNQRQIENVKDLISKLDINLGFDLVRYQFENISASRIDELVKQSLGSLDETAIERLYRSTVNEQTNELIVTSNEEIHERVKKLKKELDTPGGSANRRSPVRFYTLKNVKAIDILDTLQTLVGGLQGGQQRQQRTNDPRRLSGINARDGFSVPAGANTPNNVVGQGLTPISGNPNGNFNSQFPLGNGINSGNQGSGSSFGGGNGFGFNQNPQSFLGQQSIVGDIVQLASGFNQPENLIPGRARITVDENSNTLIVVAEPDVQQLYADLIEKLDQRRPQVLIEVTVVTITANDDFAVGIEISGGDRDGDMRLFSFTRFGLSQIDAATGALSISPGIGFNGTLVDPDIADVVLRALSGHGQARVVSAPRLLVNDNATGLLSSVAETPFASLNAGNTVSTTSFAGFTQAGTTLSVTPQISDDNYLNLDFDVLINDNSGPASDGLPPPRATNQVASRVSIPDGHTAIVGGLTRRSDSFDRQGVPIIENIPLLRWLANSETSGQSQERLFIFIKPTILRDDKFRDLRFLSEIERRDARIPDDFPYSEPVLIK